MIDRFTRQTELVSSTMRTKVFKHFNIFSCDYLPMRETSFVDDIARCWRSTTVALQSILLIHLLFLSLFAYRGNRGVLLLPGTKCGGNQNQGVKKSWTMPVFGWIQRIVPKVYDWCSIFVRVELKWRVWLRSTRVVDERDIVTDFVSSLTLCCLGLRDDSVYRVLRFLALGEL